MAQYELLLPKMGESVAEATVIRWQKNPGDSIDVDDTILEIATDKVDSEVPSPVKGILIKQLFNENDVAQVGEVIAIIETEDGESKINPLPEDIKVEAKSELTESKEEAVEIPFIPETETSNTPEDEFQDSSRFYSPLVKSIAQEEGISLKELDEIVGSGAEGSTLR